MAVPLGGKSGRVELRIDETVKRAEPKGRKVGDLIKLVVACRSRACRARALREFLAAGRRRWLQLDGDKAIAAAATTLAHEAAA